MTGAPKIVQTIFVRLKIGYILQMAVSTTQLVWAIHIIFREIHMKITQKDLKVLKYLEVIGSCQNSPFQTVLWSPVV